VNGPQTQITTQVPVGATSGPLTVQIGALVFTAGNFAVANWDGHNVFDAANNLYVASAGTNTLYQVSPAGAVSVYCQDPALQQPDGLAFDRAGNLYVSNWQNNLILKVTPAKVVSVYASGGGLANPAGLCFDATGSLYVANYTGGNVLRVAPGGGTPTTLATMANPTAIAAAPDGTFWVTAGGGSGNLDKVTYQGGVSLASTNTFANPSGIAFDSTGNAYVSERGNNRIDKVTPGGIVSTFCSMTGASNLAMRTDGVLFAASNLNFIESFASNGAPNGSLAQAVVADSQQGSSIKVDRNGNLLVCSGFGQGTNTQAVYRALWYPASSSFGLFSPLASSLPNPSAVTVDQNNNVYIGDWTDGLYRINAGGGAPYKVATGFNQVAGLACDTSTGKVYASAASGSSNGVFRFNGGTAERAYGFGEAFNGICQASPSGTFYVADAGLGQILSITSTGDLTVYKTGFSDPEDVAVGPDGSLYVAENGNNRIQRIDKNTLAVTTWASGVQDPEGIVFDNAGNLYATNYDSNNRVQRIPAGGGSPISYAINIPLPYGLAIDPAGNLFVSSRTNQSIFRIPAGVSPPFDASASTWATGVFPYNGLTPRRMAFKPATGELYFTADGDERLFRVPAAGGNWTLYSSALRRDLLGLVLGQDGNFYGSNEGYVQRLYVPGLTTDLLAQLPRSPRAIAVDAANRYVYVADGELNTIVRIDSVTDAVRTYDLQTGNNLYGVAISPVDNRLYFELDNGTARVFTNLASGTFTTYGSGVGGGREISFDAAGNMYGVTWTNSQYQDHGTVVMTPVGGGVGAPVTSVWFNGTSF